MDEASQAVRSALERDRIGDAVRELDKLRNAAPDHPVVRELDITLAQMHTEYLDQARQLTGERNFERAGSALEIAALIPQGDLAELEKVRGELEQARISEVKRSTSADTASHDAKARGEDKPKAKPEDQAKELLAKAELRIVQGQLIEPTEDNARFFLEQAIALQAEHPGIDPAKASLGDAMAARAETSLAKDDFDSVDAWLGELTSLGASEQLVRDLTDRAEIRRIELESARVIPVAEMKVTEYMAPKYPERAERKNIEGWVDVEFTVTREGETRDISVMDSEPKGLFETATRKAISRWRFEPREFRGQLIDQRVFVRVNFTF
jgi:TonB family protein